MGSCAQHQPGTGGHQHPCLSRKAGCEVKAAGVGLGSWPWASSGSAGQALYLQGRNKEDLLEGRNKEDIHRCFLGRKYLHNPEFVISSEIPGCLRDFE